jgi:hypothetical protein
MTMLLLFLISLGYSIIDEFCSIDIIVYSYKRGISREEILNYTSESCIIRDYYYVTNITYDDAVIKADMNYLPVKVVRSNVEYNGYLPVLLSLFHETRYTVVLNLDLEHSFDLDRHITEMEKDTNVFFVNSNEYGIWSLLARSIDLRYIWTKTTIKISEAHALERMVCGLKNVRGRWTAFDLNLKCEEFTELTCNSNITRRKTVGVVLSQFKRNYLSKQIGLLLNQSFPVSEILVKQDLHFQNCGSVLHNFYHVWMTNWDSYFYMRFLMPFLLKSDIIISFDDDIIPDRDGVFKFVNSIHQTNRVTGFTGRHITGIFNTKYMKSIIFIDDIMEADLITNSYGYYLDHIKVFWSYRFYSYYNGEDIHLAFSNYVECGMHSWVFGNKGFKNNGGDKYATSVKSNHGPIRIGLFKYWLAAGYQPIRFGNNDNYLRPYIWYNTNLS